MELPTVDDDAADDDDVTAADDADDATAAARTLPPTAAALSSVLRASATSAPSSAGPSTAPARTMPSAARGRQPQRPAAEPLALLAPAAAAATLFPTLPLPFLVPLVGGLRVRIVLDVVAHVLFARGVLPAPPAALLAWRDARLASEAAWCGATRRPFPRSLGRSRALAAATAWDGIVAAVGATAGRRVLASALLLVGGAPRRPKYALCIDFEGGALPLAISGTGPAGAGAVLQLPRPADESYAAAAGDGVPVAVARKAARALITEGDRLGLHGALLGPRPVTLLLLLSPDAPDAPPNPAMRCMPGYALPRDVRAAYAHLCGGCDDDVSDSAAEAGSAASASDAPAPPHPRAGVAAPLLLRRRTPRAAIATLDVAGAERSGPRTVSATPVHWYAVVSSPPLKGFEHLPPPLPATAAPAGH